MNSNYNTILESIPTDRIFIDPTRHIFPNMVDHNVFFFGRQIRTIVTRDLAVLHWWLYDVRRLHAPRIYSLIVGLGIHWCPGPMDPKPAIIQLCVGQRCIIFQLLQAPEIPVQNQKKKGHALHARSQARRPLPVKAHSPAPPFLPLDASPPSPR